MEYRLPDLASRASEESLVPLLRPRDDLALDPGPLARLFGSRHEAAAEEVVCRAMEEISARLMQIEMFHAECRFAELARAARGLIGVADQIGLRGLALSASHVAVCSEGRDAVALGATLARLQRIADGSLAEIWDLPHEPA